MSQDLSSAAVVMGALRVKTFGVYSQDICVIKLLNDYIDVDCLQQYNLNDQRKIYIFKIRFLAQLSMMCSKLSTICYK